MSAVAQALSEAIEGDGTKRAPFSMPKTDKIPMSEFKHRNLVTLSSPLLFPFGVGYFGQHRRTHIKWER